jgi:flagellar biosynthesis protein FlhB
MAEDSDLERTEEPTGRRLEEAREKGQIPRSRELTTFAVLMVGLISLIMTGPEIYAASQRLVRLGFVFSSETLADPLLLPVHLRQSLELMLRALIPFLTACPAGHATDPDQHRRLAVHAATPFPQLQPHESSDRIGAYGIDGQPG